MKKYHLSSEIDDYQVGMKAKDLRENKIKTVKENDGERLYFNDDSHRNWLDMQDLSYLVESEGK